MTPATALLQLVHVRRRRGGREVLRDVSFSLQRGDVLGLLGINGAGKSTTLAIIAGALGAEAGSVRIDGHVVDGEARGARAHVGWVPETVPLWPELTVSEALDACGRLRGLGRRARKLARARELARLNLENVAYRLCGQLSLGQKRRVGLAQALLHEPDLLVLDEPGNGLDPVQTAKLRQLITRLRPDHGIILSSHVLREVEAICSRAAILHQGRICHDAALDGQQGQLDTLFHAIAGTGIRAAA